MRGWQPYDDLVPYGEFAVQLTKDDIPQLPTLLKAVTDEAVCRMQRALARYWRAFLWQQPFGAQHANAYDLMQVQLCRRANSLAARFRSSGAHPASYLARYGVECPTTLEAAGVRFD